MVDLHAGKMSYSDVEMVQKLTEKDTLNILRDVLLCRKYTTDK